MSGHSSLLDWVGRGNLSTVKARGTETTMVCSTLSSLRGTTRPNDTNDGALDFPMILMMGTIFPTFINHGALLLLLMPTEGLTSPDEANVGSYSSQ